MRHQLHCFKVLFLVACGVALPAHSDPAGHDYPTVARVEYVQECIEKKGAAVANVYKCSCAIDWIAKQLTYDEYVEAQTYSKYATLPGEGGGIFRDSAEAKEKTKLYRTLEAAAFKGCGL
jgi:hypothetical protein